MEYHAEDPFRTIERIGEVFTLIHWPAGRQRDYALWRAVLYVKGRSFIGDGIRPEFAVRECIQKYVLVYPKGHKGELP